MEVKFATQAELEKFKKELVLNEHLDKVLMMFYIDKKDITSIGTELGFSRSKIESDLRLLRKKMSKLL